MTAIATLHTAHEAANDIAVAQPQGRDLTVPLNRLFVSTDNVRKAPRPEGIPALAALIKSQGLLQRLSVTQAGDGRFAVIAGGRRLAACQWLHEVGHYAKDQPIDCRLYDSAHAVAISLAEGTRKGWRCMRRTSSRAWPAFWPRAAPRSRWPPSSAYLR
jgi:ParB family transcriptional regulator, chromosome partitioning protein